MVIEEENHRFLSDDPIESIDEDEFRHKEYVDTLEQMVEQADPPWNIGVFGEWGSGKTSIIKMLYSRLEDSQHNYVCVEFDAWKHAEESIRTDLLLNLDQAIDKETGREVDGSPGILGEDQITQELYDVEEEKEHTTDERSTRDTLSHFIHSEKYVAYSIVVIALISLAAGVLVSPSIGAAVFTVILALFCCIWLRSSRMRLILYNESSSILGKSGRVPMKAYLEKLLIKPMRTKY